MKTKVLFLIMLVNLITTGLAFSSDPKPRVGVFLNVSAEGRLKTQIESYFEGALGSRGDVVLVKEKYDYVIDVTGLTLYNEYKREIGFVMAAIILDKYDNRFLVQNLTEEHKTALQAATTGLFHYPRNYVRVGPLEQLKSECLGIISEFDSVVLEKERARTQKPEN